MDEAHAAELLAAAKEMNTLYSYVWDRTDGCLTVFPENVKRFDETFNRLHRAICAAEGRPMPAFDDEN